MECIEGYQPSMSSPPPARERLAGDVSPAWYAVYVRSRHEFVVHDDLRRKRIESFLPSVKRCSQWKDRKKLIEYPLFQGYVFVRPELRPGACLDVLKTRGIITFVALDRGVPTPIAPEEIASLRLVMECGDRIDIFPHLKEGTRVRVKTGPLENAEGIISRKENDYLFWVNIELLGRSVAVRITAKDVEAS